MFRNLILSTKLWGFTGLLLLAVLIVAGNSILSINGMLSENQKYSEAAEHDTFMVKKEVDHLNWIGNVQNLFMSNAETLDIELDHTKCGLGKFLYGEEGEDLALSDPKLATLLNEIKEPHKHLHENGKLIKDVWQKRHKGLRNLLKDRLDDHRRWAEKVSQIVITHDSGIEVQLDHNLCGFGKFLASEEYKNYALDFPALREAMDAAQGPHRQLHESAKEIKALVQTGEYEKAAEIYKNITLVKLEEVGNQFKKAIEAEGELEKAQVEANQIFETKIMPALKATQSKMKALGDYLDEIRSSSKQEMVSTGSRSQWSACAITIVAFVLGALLSFFLIRSIVKPVKRVIEGLNDGAEQVVAATSQVSAASQHMAEGVSEQAATIEEISSSLEEMSSMIKKNADNAGQADDLMKKANMVVNDANTSMSELTLSMEDISRTSDETSKIIKTIDEIAFQTNLLALNAAVEAARAGEVGAGFAVVADEVRNLAMRAAEAAKNTASLIEGTVMKVKDGAELVSRTNETFSKVSESVVKGAELIGEIAAASSEQAQGIEQANIAVAEMDKVVQQNASNAEENAAASEEMNGQAEQMKLFVKDLITIVGGHAHDSKGEWESKERRAEIQTQKSLVTFPKKGVNKALLIHSASEVHPNDVISMDGEYFKEKLTKRTWASNMEDDRFHPDRWAARGQK
ncbi:MAG: methyl-accepting chemotaxis protein [Pseudomonadota bacterium]